MTMRVEHRQGGGYTITASGLVMRAGKETYAGCTIKTIISPRQLRDDPEYAAYLEARAINPRPNQTNVYSIPRDTAGRRLGHQ